MNVQIGRSLVSKGLCALIVAAALAGCTEVEPAPSAPPHGVTKSLVTAGAPAPHPTWTISRTANSIAVLRPGKFSMKLATAESTPQGWRIDEANEVRARFSSTGPVKTLTVCIDGRAWWDGQYRPIVNSPDIPTVSDAEIPAVMSIPEEQGRINRNTPGD